MSPNPSCEAVLPAKPLARWYRRAALVGLGLLLFLMGQFDDSIYAGLTRGWRAVLSLVGRPEWATTSSTPGISVHSWPVATSYRLLYFGLTILTLHVLLHGRATRWIAIGYGALLAACLLLLLGGHIARLPWLTEHVHSLLNTVCSLQALMVIYASAALGLRPAGRSRPREQ